MKILDIPFIRPIAIVVIFGLLALIGIMQYSSMKYELIPPMDISYLTIQTVYPGASPKEVEDQVTKKIEDAISGVAKIKHVSSQSLENASILVLEFESGTNMDLAAQDVQRNVNAKLGDMPSSVKAPSVSKLSVDDAPVVELAVTANTDKGSLYELAKDTIKPDLNRIAGVGQITLLGGNARQVKVSLQQDKIERYNIPILLVLQKIGAANLDFPAGNIKAKDGEYVVRIAGKLKNLDEMKNIVIVGNPGAGTIHLGDVAKVEDTIADSETIFRYNGKEAIGVQILKQSGANAVEVSKKINAELGTLEKTNKDINLHFEIAEDSSIFTLGSAHDVFIDIILAIIFVGIIMILFLHDLRNSFIVIMAIPATLLTTMIGMGIGNFSLNLMSLLAMTLVIGILVDDSIVVIENIHRHKGIQKNLFKAAHIGTREIAFAASSVTLVIIVSFLPVSLVGGSIGSILIQFGMTIVIATAVSLVVSLFMTPLLSYKLGESKKKSNVINPKSFGAVFDRGFGKVADLFQFILAHAVRHRIITIGVSFAVLIFSFSLLAMGFVSSEFMIAIDRGEFNIELQFPERTTLEENDRLVQLIEKDLWKRKEVSKVYAKVGYSGRSSTNYKSIVKVVLVAKGSRTLSSTQVGEQVENAIRRMPGIKVKVSQIGLVDSGSGIIPVSYNIIGQNYDENLKVAKDWLNVMKQVPGTGDVQLSVEDGKPELQVNIDRTRMADLGLSLDTVGTSLRTALTGNTDFYYQENGIDYTIQIVLDSFDRTDTDLVANLSFSNNQGRQIRLGQFASIKNGFGPTVLERLDRQNVITVSSQAIGRTSGDINKDIQAKAATLHIPSDVEVRPSGMLASQSDSFGSLGLALILSFILVYAILAILFNSLSYPISVIFSLPFAMVGGFFALAIGHQTLNIFSIMSMILLIGLAAKNAILLVDRALKNRDERGMTDMVEAFKEAVATRIRPIFMTTAAMVAGMLPIALGLGSAGEMKQSMGVLLIGGLIFGLVVTMIIVPVSFLVVEKFKNRLIPYKATKLEL